MSKRILVIVVLMAVCVIGITGLQLYWNFKNYEGTTNTFRQNSNKALSDAVNIEISGRHQQLIDSLKHWMADTSIVQITCENNNRKRTTVFHMKDTHPLNPLEKGIAIGIRKFVPSLKKINPEAKQIFIDHFIDNIVRVDLKKGFVYNYTQLLGEKLLYLFDHSVMDTAKLRPLLAKQLRYYGISADFSLNPSHDIPSYPYQTNKVNTALRRPYEKEMVWAAIQSPSSYFFGQMKWLLISSLLMIGITICCFAYTAKTLFSQQKLTRLKNDFINNMTHEINTPIASILVTTQSLKTFEHAEEVRKEFLDIIDHQAQKLKILSAQILNTNKLTKKQSTDLEIIELNGLITGAIGDMKMQSDLVSASISYQPNEIPIYIDGNPTALLHVFTNIIDNALKYNRQKPVIQIALFSAKNQATIRFTDNGIGIPESYQQKIFEDFFRVPNGNLHEVKGYGLGLSYVAQVVKNHKGKITLESNPITGSIFTIKLPLR